MWLLCVCSFVKEDRCVTLRTVAASVPQVTCWWLPSSVTLGPNSIGRRSLQWVVFWCPSAPSSSLCLISSLDGEYKEYLALQVSVDTIELIYPSLSTAMNLKHLCGGSWTLLWIPLRVRWGHQLTWLKVVNCLKFQTEVGIQTRWHTDENLVFTSKNVSSHSSSGCESDSNLSMWIYVLLGNVLRGIGETPVQPLGISYIDDFATEENAALYVGKKNNSTLSQPTSGLLKSVGCSIMVLVWSQDCKAIGEEPLVCQL